MKGCVFWDFDGTLGFREGLWSGALLDAIRSHIPGSTITVDQIKPQFRRGFPWHSPDVVHDYLREADRWWAQLELLFAETLRRLGIDEERVPLIAQSVRSEYLDPKNWRAANDAHMVLSRLRIAGWKQYIVSNHVPELPLIVSFLGIAEYFDSIFCSALIGIEKPNPAFAKHVLSSVQTGPDCWWIGDSIEADVMCAHAAGIKSILLGSSHHLATFCISSLTEIPDIVDGNPKN